MEKIKTKTEFEHVLSLEKAMVFIFFGWSGQAHFSKRIVKDWEIQNKTTAQVFEMNPEDSEEFSKWVVDNDIHGHGYGSVVWLQKGKIVDFIKDAGKSGIGEIERRTISALVINDDKDSTD